MTVPGNPAKIDIKVRCGDTETFTFNVEDDDGTPIDLGSSTFQAQIRASAAATATIASFSTVVTSAGGGQFYISLSSGTTTDLTARNAVWDLQQTVSGVVSTLIAGDVRIVQDVTR